MGRSKVPPAQLTGNGLTFVLPKRKQEATLLHSQSNDVKRHKSGAPVFHKLTESSNTNVETNRFEKKSKASSKSNGAPLQFEKKSESLRVFERPSKKSMSDGFELARIKRDWSVSPSPPPVVNPIVGSCKDLEKEYHRGEGNVETTKVRPYEILKKSFTHVMGKSKEKDYKWVKNQLKSIRQDMLVQDIRDSFTWDVYVCAATEAIRNSDAGELTQTLAHLKRLEHHVCISDQAKMEISAYRILFHTLRENFNKVDEEISLLLPKNRGYGCIRHALMFSAAYSSHNFFLLRKLVPKAPNSGKLVVDIFLPSLRLTMYKWIIQAYDVLTVPDLLHFLCFTSNGNLKQFLKQNGAQPTSDKNGIRCRESFASYSRLTSDNYNPQFADLQET